MNSVSNEIEESLEERDLSKTIFLSKIFVGRVIVHELKLGESKILNADKYLRKRIRA